MKIAVYLAQNRMDKMIPERELAIDILAEFEELLESHGILILDNYREGGVCEARLYGQAYYDLEDKVTDLICKFAKKER